MFLFLLLFFVFFFFFFNDTATTEIYTLSLHDALPISGRSASSWPAASLTCAVSCSVWPITRPGAAAVTLTEATGGGGDWESLLHAATAPAPHSSRRCMALTSRSGRDTVSPLLSRGVGRINSWRLLRRTGRG